MTEQPSSLHPFEIKLNKFLDETMARWVHINHQRIGLSIQVQGSVQDSNSATRAIYTQDKMKAHHRNKFCQKIYQDPNKEIACNNLDLYLKKRVLPGSTESLSCRCHQGVSNFLIPYHYPKDELEITWYIYIGQFLLIEDDVPAVNERASESFRRLEIFDIGKSGRGDEDEAQFVKPNVFIKKGSQALKKFKGYDISQVNFIGFIRFREFALTRFQSFLDTIYGRSEAFLEDEVDLESLKQYVKDKKAIATIQKIIGKIYDLLDSEIPVIHHEDKSLISECNALKDRFHPAIPENPIFFKDHENELTRLVNEYATSFTVTARVKTFLSEVKKMTDAND